MPACGATLPRAALPRPLLVFRVADRVTGGGGTVRASVLGFECDAGGDGAEAVLPDWRLLERLNGSPAALPLREAPSPDPSVLQEILTRGMTAVTRALPDLDLGFRHPATELVALLWPA